MQTNISALARNKERKKERRKERKKEKRKKERMNEKKASLARAVPLSTTFPT